MALAPGDKVDRFVVVSRIGEGRHGEVYRANDERLRRQVALKILRATSPEGRAALLRQAMAASAIIHPNAIQLFEVGTSAGHAFVAMELAEQSLGAIVASGEASLDQRVAWLVDAARAIAAAHERKVIHRNLSLENVLVRDDGTVKVTDFGLDETATGARFDANAETIPAPLHTLKSEGASLEPLLHASPEQLRGQPLDGRSDVFAWGVVAYEALAGRSPWQGKDPMSLASQILEVLPPPLHTIAPGVSVPLAGVIARALAKAKEARFASINDAADALAATRTVGARPRAASTHVPLAIAVGLIVATVSASVVLLREPRSSYRSPLPHDASPATAPPPSPEPEPTSSVPEALALYRAGLQGIHDGADRAAMANFARAAQLDPQLAAAHLRAVIYWTVPEEDDRENMRKATELRALLSPRDRVLRDAFEPWVTVPQDGSEAERRLTAAAAERPGDTDVGYNLCHIREAMGRYAEALPACEAVLRVDDTFAGAWRYYGAALGLLDRTDEAARAFRRCLDVSPQATSCDMDLYYIEAQRGNCSDVLAAARRELAADPANPQAYERLANALYATNAPIESVREAVDQQVRNARAEERRETELIARAKLALASGRIDEARATIDELESAVRLISQEDSHVDALILRVAVDRETKRYDDIESAVKRYLRERAGWIPQTVGADPTIHAYDALYLAGRGSRTEFVHERDAWIVRDRARHVRGGLVGQPLALEWWMAFALPVRNRADAVDAVAALPDHLPMLAQIVQRPDYMLDVGVAFELAEKPTEAEEWFRRATRACWGLAYPVETVRAHAALARVLEARGARDEACSEYGWVLDRWPASTRTKSAQEAAAGRERLSCSK